MSPSNGKWPIIYGLAFLVVTISAGLLRTNDLTEKIIQIVLKESEKIPLKDFEDDPILFQKVDRVNSISSYHMPIVKGKETSKSIYSHDGVDSSKQTIVLYPGTGHSKFEKRRFVILRQTPDNKREYFAAFAYVRNAQSKDKEKFVVGNQELSIEFAQWDNRDDGKNVLKNLGWSECRSTIFVPCWTNETDALKIEFSLKTPIVESKSLQTASSKSVKSVNSTPKNSSSSSKILSASGTGEFDSTYDFFGDLEDDSTSARYAGESVKYTIKGKIVTTSLNGKIELDIIQNIKTGKISLTDLSPDLLKAIMVKYGQEKVGKETFQELYSKLNFTKIQIGNEQFLGDDAAYMVEEILDGSNSTDILHENEIVVEGPKVTTKPKLLPTTSTTPAPASNKKNTNKNQNNPHIIIINNNQVTNNKNVNNNYFGPPVDYATGGKDDGSPPHKTSRPAISETEKTKLFEEFQEKLKIEAEKNCPPGKTCKVFPVSSNQSSNNSTTTGQTPFTGGTFGGPSEKRPHDWGYQQGAFGYPAVGYATYYPTTTVIVASPPSSYACSGFGCFGRGFSSTGGGRSVSASNMPDTSSYLSHPGWKPLNPHGSVNITLNYEELPFIGFGYCPVKVVTLNDLKRVSTEEQAAIFYMDLLRTSCIKTELPYIQVLYNRHCLTLEADKSFDVPSTCSYLQKKKLSGLETRELSRAFELSILSKQIVDELNSPFYKSTLTPDGKPISRAVHTLGKVVYNALALFPSKVPLHSVELTRNLVLTLKTALRKALEDWKEIVDRCDVKECLVDKNVNENDRFYLLALTEFIIRGVGNQTGSADIVQVNFESFYKINHNALQSRLSDYN